MGLLKRLVVAIEKIAAREPNDEKAFMDDFGKTLKEAMKYQAYIHIQAKRDSARDQYDELLAKKKLGHDLTEQEQRGLEIGNELFLDKGAE